MVEHHSVKRATAGIADTDTDRKPGDVRVRPGRPTKRVGSQLAPRTDKLTERTAFDTLGTHHRGLDQPAFPHLNIHAANLTDCHHDQQPPLDDTKCG
ncbi:hypothetical protein GCM10010201_36410 [Pilimelia columellifera subsp. columellifera]|uniref:Uncharacterized protein n=1 Tax=Pilimelia columellifera subsp. columellifera TaxID=706583 RepID=A0ABP6B511_9ACTN